MKQNVEMLKQALSLRTPQEESLQILADIVGAVELSKTPHNPDILAKINTLSTPKIRRISDFERDFPSLCFSLATGVGKTRLMGAFITYLYLEKGMKNFFIVAPNLTIYNKLITEFRERNHPKYVFKGINEFATNRPLIITGDEYMNMGGITSGMHDNDVKINIFNISKINKEDRPDKKTGKSQFRSFKETLGESYFDYLKSLPDLVVLMDEAHRYRADAGMKTLNEIGPVLGLELTATAKETGVKGKDFSNIIYHYSLAQAIHDGYVKKPAIVGRSDFDSSRFSEDKLEEIKLEDGFKIHEDIKAELIVFADEKKKHLVKPFLLVIAKDTAHADELKALIDSKDYKEGKYKGKVIVLHSNQKSVESDENINLLLGVEKVDNPIEVVIHVNKLAEGWDVNNLYTIVPLRAAKADILVEQSIGRGLRLPYGEPTGVDAVDRLHIVAHDKFNEIVETAKKEGFEFQRILLDEDPEAGKRFVVEAKTTFHETISSAPIVTTQAEQEKLPLAFQNEAEKEMAEAVAAKLEEMQKIVSNIDDLKKPEIQKRIIEEIKQDKQAEGKFFFAEEEQVLQQQAQQTTERYIEANIKIPQIAIYRRMPNKDTEYKRFQLNLRPFDGLKPVEQKIIVRELLEQKTESKGKAGFVDQHPVLSHYIIEPMLNMNEFLGSDVALLSFFAEQVIEHIKTYTKDEEEVKKILFFNADKIAEDIAEQMNRNIIEPEMETVVKVNGDYAPLRPQKILAYYDDGELNFRQMPKNLSRIRNIVFTGFKKCLSSKTKFDSNTERELSVILEDETKVIRWERLSNEQAKEKIPLFYTTEDKRRAAYCPDFIVETTDEKYIIETKSQSEMTAKDVESKKEVAERWCTEATKYEKSVNGKPWSYVLIPHDKLLANTSFDKLVNDWKVR